MKEAQHAKVARALRMAQVKYGDRVLEIGCGWGALAEKACTDFGASVVGVTLSTEQLEWAKARMKRQGLAALSDYSPGLGGPTRDLRLQDYRDIGKTMADAPFDAICSIEMVEAVGRQYWPEYFATAARQRKPA